jgi:transcriptional regulator with XRE-family HTH domain
MTETDLRHIFSKNLKSLRELRSLSQEEMAEKAGISIPYLSKIERCINWPSPNVLVNLAKALDVEVYVLFQEKLPIQCVDAQDVLAQFKKDIGVSLQKTVLKAINYSIETIGSHYLKGKKRPH